MEYTIVMQMEDVGVLSAAVQTWYRHYRMSPDDVSTRMLCSSAVDFFNQGYKTQEELTALLIEKIKGERLLEFSASPLTSLERRGPANPQPR
jgi:hypothetical protein